MVAVKDMYPRLPNAEIMSPVASVVISTDKLRQRLLQEGVSEVAIRESEEIMRAELLQLHKHIVALKHKQLLLMDTLRQLETEKVDLENTLLEDQRQSKVDEGDPYLSSQEKYSGDGKSPIGSVGFNYPLVQRRKKLPDPVEKENGVSLWSIIKDNIGKDLTKVCLPVYFNEPLSSLQKCFEDLEYSYLLDQANEWGKMGDRLMRMLHVAAFAISGYASTNGRTCKPFNPLLGETYEADYPDKGLRFISEKVDPVGVLTLEFDDGEVFHWSKVTTSIYNLILGKLYCDHYGTMRLEGNREFSCKIKFKEQSIIDRNPHQIHGVVEDKKGRTVATLFGKWDESLHYVIGGPSGKGKGSNVPSKPHLLWKRNPVSEHQTRYNLTQFALTLNEITPGLKEKLPPTDSRLRPDQRSLENGQYEMANSEKLRLEQRQRQMPHHNCQARKMQEKGWKPRWFAKEKGSNTYSYVGGYWETREKGNWESCPDIFGQLPADNDSISSP
ncbi:Oxysterol-binding protein [Sesbania bispinosa]|nr:Oxysterol-binding protein [Sesbania bispinosa]